MLGEFPTLTEINTELSTTGQSLSTCIANAGKTGVWDRQSDFAYYSADVLFYATPAAVPSAGADILVMNILAPKTTTLKRIELLPTGSMVNYVVDMFKGSFSNGEQAIINGGTYITSQSPVKRVTGNNFTSGAWLSINMNIAITNAEALAFALYDGANVIPNKNSANLTVNTTQGTAWTVPSTGLLGSSFTGEFLIRMYE